MKQRVFTIIATLFLAFSFTFGQNQDGPKTPEQMATEEAIRFEKLLKLEPHQAFYIDSIMQHDMKAMYQEMDALRDSGIQDFKHYDEVRKRWVDQMDKSFQKVLTPEQFVIYQKDVGRYKKEKKAKKAKQKKDKREKDK